jgi:4-amino-4-deoxy-L-arabinose transferase-like glycosyltransferase
LPAIAGIIAGYFLFKALAGRSVAVLAAFLLAVSQWHVTVSRWGWDALLMSLLQLAAYWFLIRGVQSGGKRYFLGGGLLIGLCLYTYVASWIALAIALAFLVIRAARDRAEAPSRIRELALFVIGCAIVFAPLGAHYIRHPMDLTVRVSEVSLARTVEQANSYLPLWENVKSHALMFNYRGDNNPRHGFPGAPALDFVTSVFFVLGLAHYLRFWRDPQRLFVIVWFVLGLQGGLLAEPSASPHAYRTLMISAAACLFAAAAAHAFFRAGSATLLNVRHGRAMAVAITTVLLTAIAVDNFRIYFFKRPGSRVVWEEENRDGGLAALLAAYRAGPALVLVDPLLLWKVVVANTWFLTYRPGKLFDSPFLPAHLLMTESRLARESGERQLVFIFSPVFWTMMRQWIPDAAGELVRSPFQEPLYGVVRLSVADLRTRLAATEGASLAAAVDRIARHYAREAAADGEAGPRREFLLLESRIGTDLVQRLRTQSR